jgi:PAS domain-containing protein
MLRSTPSFATEDRWVAMPASVRHLIELDYSCGDDMRSFLSEAGDRAALRDNKSVRQLLNQGLTSWFSLRLHAPDGSIAMLSLMDEGFQSYGADTADKIEKLGLRHALHAVLKLDADNESLFQFDLVKQMAQAHSDRQLAALVVQKLASFYEWQNVAIIKVNGHEQRFELLEQAEGKAGGYSLPKGYTQPLHTGFLGIVHDEDRIVFVGDSRDSDTAEIFCGNCTITRSEMCVPIHVEDKIVWILNIEDSRPHAFKAPDKEKVERLMLELEPSLEKALGSALLDQVLDDAPDAIVITDFGGTILKCNRAATLLLGGRAEGEGLAGFFQPGSKGQEVAMRTRSERSVPVEAVIVGRDGRQTQVLMRARVPRDEYERRVVILQDRLKIDGQAETRKLAEVTSETRVPLSLVSTFVRQIKRLTADTAPSLERLADHAIEQLGRVELSYDRVLASAGGPARRVKVDVASVTSQLLEALPAEQRRLIRLDPPSSPLPLVRTERRQLAEAVESMLAYLLRVGGAEVPISGRIRASGGRVEIRLFKPHSSPAEGEADKCAGVNEARARGALDEPRLYQFAALNGGDFNRRRGRHGETLRLTLKATRPRHV